MIVKSSSTGQIHFYIASLRALHFNTNLLESKSTIKPGMPKNTIPILAALGSPSKTELTDQAMEKTNKRAPNTIAVHDFQSS